MAWPEWTSPDGRIRLICGDALEVRDSLPPIDAVIADPPYGMNWNTDSKRFTGGKGYHDKSSARVMGDDKPFDPSPWLDYPRVVLWGSNHFGNRLPIGSTLVWLKKRMDKLGVILSDCEVAWERGGHGVYAFRCVWDGCARESENRQHYHPTQKPAVLMRWCIERNTEAGELVLDPYAGSGTTAVACVQSDRRCIAIERDPEHFATAIARLKAEYARTALFDGVCA
jgi:site-specific DNA-methyltransferase (adenine-specific)